MIEVDNLFYRYPSGVEALRGVSLEVRRGEFLAIMGKNGAGKTTLVKHFNGLLKPTRGSVKVDGVDTRKLSVAELSRKVGLVFQNPDHQLFCETVEEEISFALRNFGFDEKTIERRVEWALHLLDLERYRRSSPLVLSGGERKRVALASVLAWDPEVLVLDEPTIGQDQRQKEILRQFILQLNAQGKTVVMVTHDVEFVAECKPRVVLMSDGRIIADGEAKTVLTDFKTLREASIIPPQITQLFSSITGYGFPCDVIDLWEAKSILQDVLLGGKVG
ncbi:MAG: ABC transporter ATP-binding protein [Thermoproteota archaeon]|nr:MAG: ABC transporter ATP-binding protein [Candidatus Korarchaeota archaeon]